MRIVSPDSYLINEDGQYEWSPARASEAWDRAYRELNHELGRALNEGVPVPLLITVGIPGSGKTTFLKADDHGTREEHMFKHVVAFDATLTTVLSRRPLIEIARENRSRVEALVFDNVPLYEALVRNAKRPEERRVPYDSMMRMARAMDEEPPTLREGFWRITSVQESPFRPYPFRVYDGVMSHANIDPKLALALITAIKKGVDAGAARSETKPGVYRNLKLDLTLEVSEMRVNPDTDKSPTSSIPLLPTVALLLKRMGVGREAALEILRDVMEQALQLGKDASKQLLEQTGVAEMEQRLKEEVIAKLPRVPVKGAVLIQPEAVTLTIKGMSADE